ncbi:MAG: hypothetical protein PHH06_00100 [Candidatus Gracilibacteria bacterium]|nr:hypothetical protein [Candidatus Gracilibacteria bacterium]
MENLIGEMIKSLIVAYFLYYFILIFSITSIIYLTYRFWKMILPKEEHNIFIENAPMIGYRSADHKNEN